MRQVDLITVFEGLSADRTLNIIDTIMQDDVLEAQMIEEGIEHIRAKIYEIYDGSAPGAVTNSSYDGPEMHSGTGIPRKTGKIKFTEQTDAGYVGLEAPLG